MMISFYTTKAGILYIYCRPKKCNTKDFKNPKFRLLLRNSVEIISEFWGIPHKGGMHSWLDLSLCVALPIFLPIFRTLGVLRKDSP